MKAVNLSISFLMLVLSAHHANCKKEIGGNKRCTKYEQLVERYCPAKNVTPGPCVPATTSPGEPVYPISNVIETDGSRTKQNMTVATYKFGHASVAGACAEASNGGWAHVKGKMSMTGVSSTSVQKQALKISEYLKTEYKEEFKHEVSNTRVGASVGFDWLGISASGEYSNQKTVVDKYEFGSSSLDAAREEYTSSFDDTLDTKIVVEVEILAEGNTPFTSKVCTYIQVEKIEFTDSRSQYVVSDDADTMECVTPDLQTAKCKNGKISVVKVD